MKKLLIIPLLLLMISCSVKKEFVEVPKEVVKEVPVEVIKTEQIKDSIYLKDTLYIRGDTIFKDRVHFKYNTIIRVDTVPKIIKEEKIVPIKEERIVEKKSINWTLSILISIGLLLIALFLKRLLAPTLGGS